MHITDTEVSDFSIFAEELAEAAGRVISPYFRSARKAAGKVQVALEPVVLADRAAERQMREMIARRYPGHGVDGEEEGYVPGSSPFTWVLDPIDGARSFVTGLPLWGTLIALNDGEHPRVGVMNQPFTDEQFLGTPEGSWLNGKAIKARPCSGLDEASVSFTFVPPFQNAGLGDIAQRVGMARFDGDCYAYCMVACGYIDAVIDVGLKPYDIQALIPIIHGAGGIVSTWDGADAQHGGAVVACGDRRLHDTILRCLQAESRHASY